LECIFGLVTLPQFLYRSIKEQEICSTEYTCFVNKLKERVHLAGVGVGGKVILKLILYRGENVDWIHLVHDWDQWYAVDDDNELLGSVEVSQSFTHLYKFTLTKIINSHILQ